VYRVTIGPRKIAGEVSSSRNPIDINRNPYCSIGTIIFSSVAVGRSRVPNISEILGP
jgi:hypothetical protein